MRHLIRRFSFLVASYLLGSLPIVFLLGRARGVDLRTAGTGNVGGGNLWQTAGAIYGVAGGLSDVAKGALPPLMARRLGLDGWTLALAGLAGVVGQCWPIFLKFNGGRGVSASLGMHAVLAPKELTVAAVPMVAAMLARNLPLLLSRDKPLELRLRAQGPRTRFVPLTVILGLASMPLLTWWRQRPRYVVFAGLADLGLIVARRLTANVSQDLRKGVPLGKTLLSRLLYDRPYEG